MPQSRTRKGADAKRKAAQARKTAERQQANEERRAADAPTAAERRRAKRAEREAARAEESKSSGSSGTKSSGTKSSDSKSSGTKPSDSKSTGIKSSSTKSTSTKSTGKDAPRRRTTAERRGVASKGSGPQVRRGPASRRWVPPTFITAFALGVVWLIVYYVAGNLVPVMKDLGNWNILIGMGLMAVSFIIATLWK